MRACAWEIGEWTSGNKRPLLARWVGLEMSTAGVSHAELMLFGGLIVWFLIVEPYGLAKLWAVARQKLRLWPFPH